MGNNWIIICNIVGDVVGKTSLAYRYTENIFQPCPSATIGVDFFVKKVTVEGKTVKLQLWTFQGIDGAHDIRNLYYRRHGTITIICFSLLENYGLQRVKDKWYPEIRHHNPTSPIILVGTQLDLRQRKNVSLSEKENHVSYDEGLQAAVDIGAMAYFESSAWTGQGVQEIFDTAMKIGLSNLKE